MLFADLVGFTALGELRDPEQLKLLVDRCFERLVADITAFGGSGDKIVGDAIVALFGAPLAHEDDPERAVRAALRMQRTVDEVSADLDTRIRMRIGVNTGEVLVGALRAGGDYTAMGDTVNLAARLETTAAPGEILVGPTTYEATREVVRYDATQPEYRAPFILDHAPDQFSSDDMERVGRSVRGAIDRRMRRAHEGASSATGDPQ